MIPDDARLTNPQNLLLIVDRLVTVLLKSSTKVSKYISYQIEFLEVTNYELKRFDKLGYCDFELAYVCYNITSKLLDHCRLTDSAETKELTTIISDTLSKKHDKIEELKSFISSHSDNATPRNSIDELTLRFNNLSRDKKESPTPTTVSIDSHKYTETITGPQLHDYFHQSKSILLIDYRTKKEFNYNHINHANVVNIEPSVINSLLSSKNNNLTDQDLETRLKLLLPDSQYSLFQQRHKFDLIVIYNLKFGVHKKTIDRFEELVDLIIGGDNNGNPSKNPFVSLIDILAYRNKYISSKLKRSPCYLNGGVSYWYSLFGEKSIVKTTDSALISPPPPAKDNKPSLSNYSVSSKLADSVSGSSPYLTNFGDYLGTAKGKSTPVSSTFESPSGSSRFRYYKPSAPLHPDLSKYSGSSSHISSISDPPPLYSAEPNSMPKQQPSNSRRASFSSSIGSSFSGALNGKASLKTSEEVTASNGATNNPTKFLEQYTTGLVNLGNSCYMNCILQCIGGTPQLTKFFFPTFPLTTSSYRQHINVNNKLGTKGILTNNFVNLLMNMFGNTGSSYSPLSFKKVMGSLSPGHQFDNFDQQDCIEFLNFLLDSLHEDLNQMLISDSKEKQAIMELTPEQEKIREYLPIRLASTIEWERYLKLNFSVIVDYFQGQYLSQLKCLECGLTSTTFNAFLILSLPIPEKLNKSNQLSLDDCLQEFVETELLDDENKWHCPKCKRFTRLTKKMTISRLPQVLIIHFKRFKISPAGYFSKIDSFINYPVDEVLDLTSYWPVVGSTTSNESIMPKEKEEQILNTLPTRNQVPPFKYKLYAVANHFGNLTTGHYTSYVFKESDKKKSRGWCYFDDSKVTYNHRANQVLNKNAYCLFYQRI